MVQFCIMLTLSELSGRGTHNLRTHLVLTAR